MRRRITSIRKNKSTGMPSLLDNLFKNTQITMITAKTKRKGDISYYSNEVKYSLNSDHL